MDDLIRSNGFGPFHCQGVEILRRVFVTVRDRDWREISPTYWNCAVNEALRTIVVEARHVSELVDFKWQGVLEVSADSRSVHFAFEGEVQRDMDVCRLGLIVLHAVETMVGARITAHGPQGRGTLVVAPSIAPQPIIQGTPAAMMQSFSALTIERADLGSIELHFEGDLFELEDQRNWGDASFKSYCTPLKVGFPREIPKGTRIAQRFELSFSPPNAPLTAGATQAPRRVAQGVFPTIGRNWLAPSLLVPHDHHWRHLHVDLSHPDDLLALEAGLDDQSPPLEIGIQDHGSVDRRSAMASWIAGQGARILRVMLYGEGMSPPSLVCVATWRLTLDILDADDLPLFAATRGYFVEFNRSSAIPDALSGLAFPLTATVHADDPCTIAENVATILDIADSARHLSHSRSSAIAPLALYYPPSLASKFPREMVAPWLAATLMYAGGAGVTSVTLADDVASRAPASLLDRLLQCADFSVTLFLGDQPKGVHAGLLHRPAQSAAEILALNLNSESAQLQLKGFAECVRSFRKVSGDVAVITDGTRVDIPAFGVCWLECELS